MRDYIDREKLLRKKRAEIVCSECGTVFSFPVSDMDRFYYCPCCGVKMSNAWNMRQSGMTRGEILRRLSDRELAEWITEIGVGVLMRVINAHGIRVAPPDDRTKEELTWQIYLILKERAET